MTKILAFDQATLTGWCFGGTTIDLHDWETGHFRAMKRQEEGERLNLIKDQAVAIIDRFNPSIVAFEEPYDPTPDAVRAVQAGKQPRTGYNQKTMQFLQRVKGAILMAAAERSVPTEGYQPRSWQATLKLPKISYDDSQPNAKKKLVRDAVRRMGAQVSSFDEADAWGLCYHCLHGAPGIARATDDLFERAKAVI